MKSIKALGFFSIVTIISSCSTHSIMRGSVAMKTGPNEAHVCLGNNEVKVGDKVRAYKNSCKSSLGVAGKSESAGPKFACTKELAGAGVVTSLINEHYSVVKFDESVKFDEGTIVEKE